MRKSKIVSSILIAVMLLLTTIVIIPSIQASEVTFHSILGTVNINGEFVDPGENIDVDVSKDPENNYPTTIITTDDDGYGHNLQAGFSDYPYQGATVTFTVAGSTDVYEVTIDKTEEDQEGTGIALYYITMNFTVDDGNEPPVADANGPYTGVVDSPVTFDGSASSDPDGTVEEYRWDYTNDGTYDTDWLTTDTTTFTYTTAGSYTVKVQVKDDGGKTNTDTADVTISEDESPPDKVTGLTVTDAKDGKLDLSWDAAEDDVGISHYKIYQDGVFLRNSSDTTERITGLTNGQTYMYRVSAVDLAGKEGEPSDNASGTPTASPSPGPGPGPGPTPDTNNAPNADAGGPYQALVGTDITFDGSESSDPDDDDIQYRWDFDNDGTYDTDYSDEATATSSYDTPGTYTVKLQVKDDGGKTDTDTAQVTILQPNNPPTAPEVTAPEIEEDFFGGNKDVSYPFTALSTDADDDDLQYTFDWGDASNDTVTMFLANATLAEVNHTYPSAGKYVLSVTANDNQTDSEATDLTIWIDAIPVNKTNEIGYITDDDSDGVYDTFHPGMTAVERLDNGSYLIDEDGDEAWDWIFDPETDTLTQYHEGETETPADYTWLFLVILIILLFLIIVGYLYRRQQQQKAAKKAAEKKKQKKSSGKKSTKKK